MNKKMMIGVIAMFVAFLTQSVFALDMGLFIKETDSVPLSVQDIDPVKENRVDVSSLPVFIRSFCNRYDGYDTCLSYYGEDINNSRLITVSNTKAAKQTNEKVMDNPEFSGENMLSETEKNLEQIVKILPVVRSEKLKDGLKVTMYDASEYAKTECFDRYLTVLYDDNRIVWYTTEEGFGDAVYTSDGRYMVVCRMGVHYVTLVNDKIVDELFYSLPPAVLRFPVCTILTNNIVRLVYPHKGNRVEHWKVVLSPEDMAKITEKYKHLGMRNLLWSSVDPTMPEEGMKKDSFFQQNAMWNYKAGGDEPTYTDTDFHLPKAEADTLQVNH